jgi:hypothetical protein
MKKKSICNALKISFNRCQEESSATHRVVKVSVRKEKKQFEEIKFLMVCTFARATAIEQHI